MANQDFLAYPGRHGHGPCVQASRAAAQRRGSLERTLFQHVRKNRRSKGDFERDLCSRGAMLTIATPNRCPVSHCSHACGCVARDTSWISVGVGDGPAPTLCLTSLSVLRGNCVRGRGSAWRGGLIPWHAYPCGGLQGIQCHHAQLVAARSMRVRQSCDVPTPCG